jgi:hypothetical protein
VPCGLPDEAQLTEDIIALAEEFGRYGYRRITGVLNNSGWHVNHQGVERIWRREGARLPSIATEEETALAERQFVRPAAAGCGRSARTMSGPMTLFGTGPTTGVSTAR